MDNTDGRGYPLVWILGPSGSASRRRAAAAIAGVVGSTWLTGTCGAGSNGGQGDVQVGDNPERETPADLKAALKELRRRSAARQTGLLVQFCRSLEGSRVFLAHNAAAAARYIMDLVGPDTAIIANRSSTVLGEIAPKLAELGFQVHDSYLDEFGPFDKSIEDCWDLPRLIENGICGNFQVVEGWQARDHQGEAGQRLKKCVAVLGVSAASAADGSLYFLQHAGNIGQALRTAATIVFVIGLDKLAGSREEAILQTRCTGIFGMESMLLRLRPGTGEDAWPEALPDHAGEDQEVHFLILDNGRSRLPGTAHEELLACIGCKSCLNQCPLGRHMTGDGRTWSPRDQLFLYLQGSPEPLESCLHCEACRIECPLEIDLPRLMWRAQEDRVRAEGRGLRERLMGDPEIFARAGSRLAPLANALVRSSPGNLAIKQALGLDRHRLLPEFRSPTLKRWFASRRASAAPLSRGGWPDGNRGRQQEAGPRRKAAYYAGCFATYYQPEVGQALVAILESAGIEVILPEQRCCGMPMMAARNFAGARRNAGFNAASLAPLVAAGYDIVTTCPSCSLMLKQEYPAMTAGAGSLPGSIFDSTQYLAMLVNEGMLSLDAARWDGPVVHHLPCHLKAQGLQQEAGGLLRSIPGLSVDHTSSICCGMAGYHGYKRQHAGLAGEIGARLFTDLDREPRARIVTSCAACKMQIEWGTGRRAIHPVLLLREACRK